MALRDDERRGREGVATEHVRAAQADEHLPRAGAGVRAGVGVRAGAGLRVGVGVRAGVRVGVRVKVIGLASLRRLALVLVHGVE